MRAVATPEAAAIPVPKSSSWASDEETTPDDTAEVSANYFLLLLFYYLGRSAIQTCTAR